MPGAPYRQLILFFLLLAVSACGGASYVLLPPADEGSVAEPVSIALDMNGEAQYSGQVGMTNSYYAINGVAPGEYYHVSLTLITNDVDLYVYSSSDFTGYLDGSSNPGTEDESAIVNTAATDLYIKVKPFDAPDGARFHLNITHKPLVDEGTALSPVSLVSSEGHVGTVGLMNSYYVLPVEPGVHEISLAGLEGSPEIIYFDGDSGYLDRKYTCAGPSCLVTASSSMMYLAVDGSGTASGDVYELVAGPYPGQTEGTPDSPVQLTLDSEYDGSVFNTSVDSYYSVGVTSGNSYGITLSNIVGDVDLFVYNAPGFGVQDCSDETYPATSKSCSLGAGGTGLFIRIHNWSASASTYILNSTAN